MTSFELPWPRRFTQSKVMKFTWGEPKTLNEFWDDLFLVILAASFYSVCKEWRIFWPGNSSMINIFVVHFFSLKNRRKVDSCRRLTKKMEEISRKFYGGPWKASLLRDFVQIVTLTVAFFDWVSKTCHFSRWIGTVFFVLSFYGGF